MPTMDLMGLAGHITISWRPDMEDDIKDFVRRMRKKGVRFFIIERRSSGKETEKEVTRASMLSLVSKIKVQDEDVQTLLENGMITLSRRGEGYYELIRKAVSEEDVVKHDTIAHRGAGGG